ncbi:ribosome silencing factor [Phocaeicola salanitronis]|uniref:ribosome silencing factor n=1 Tax=Phocaeicola salanitronis TaxID=376805 RepID=UPI0032095720
MNETKTLVEKITEGIQEKKGKNIIIADLSGIEDTICKFFIICQGNSPSQILAITDSVRDYVKKTTGEKVYAIDGLRNAQWVAMDYGNIMVHIFLPEARAHYNLETLWADAKLTAIPDLD